MPSRSILIAAALAMLAGPAFADGTVVRAKGCGDKIFIASEDNYSVLVASQQDAMATADSDLIVGDIDRIGFGFFYDSNSGRRFTASVEERGLTRNEITTRIAVSCRAENDFALISGEVDHADGCGKKIFVNTPQGYVILERLSGGIIANGDTLVGSFNRAGRATVKNPRTGAEFVVFIDDFQVPKSAASRKIAESCH